ncbi:MAG TPA: hypothetical protein VJR24_11605 [Gemmatimonadaceae bacterium]|nr:hypothetical protein [Gemmatimonadaceae bacterium]
MTTTDTGKVTDRSWRLALGSRWMLWVGIGALLMFALGFAAPLADPDLPMHLATGAWIVKHAAVPWVEPFAWTRWGAPYYAYSWLPEVVYQLVYVHVGAAGLRVLHGLTQVATGGAILWLASLHRWKVWTALFLIFLTVVTSTIIAGFLRPQALLVPLILLSWACGLRVLDGSRPLRSAVVLAVVAALAANTHLLFPLTGLPFAIAMSRTPFPTRRAALVALALVVGWVATPYGLVWPEVFRFYFGHNPLFDYPSTITEFTPGFRFASHYPLWMFVAALLAVTPWALSDAKTSRRERVVFAGIWFIGLVGFAMALRAIVVWWFATLPMLALVLERIPEPRTPFHRRALSLTFAALPVALVLNFGRMGERLGKGIVPAPRASVEPLAQWLDDHVRLTGDGRPRMLTNFDYGSYLTWRLPAYSMSIDGRTIFPDSVAAPEAYRFADQGAFPLGPWREADVAIVPRNVPVASVLDTATGWIRLDSVPAGRGVPLASGLWAREDWLRRTASSSHR